MLKTLNRNDTITAPYVAIKKWNLSNVSNEDLVLTENGNTVAVENLIYRYTSIETASLCSVAKEEQENDLAEYREGIRKIGFVYPTQEPLNPDGTYKRVIYNQIKTIFYNNYRDPTKIWGMEKIDFDLSKTKKFLSDLIKVFYVPTDIMGENLIKKSIVLTDNSIDNTYTITDDGNCNLFAGTNLFSKFQIIGDFVNYFISGSSQYCDSYFNIITGSVTTTTTTTTTTPAPVTTTTTTPTTTTTTSTTSTTSTTTTPSTTTTTSTTTPSTTTTTTTTPTSTTTSTTSTTTTTSTTSTSTTTSTTTTAPTTTTTTGTTSTTTTTTPAPMDESMPLDQAIYNPETDTIFAVRGGTIFELSSVDGSEITHSQYDPDGMSPATLCYVSSSNTIYASAWNNLRVETEYRAGSHWPIQRRYIYTIDPNTFLSSASIDIFSRYAGASYPTYAQPSVGVRQIIYNSIMNKLYFSVNLSDGYSIPTIIGYNILNPNDYYDYNLVLQGMGMTDIAIDTMNTITSSNLYYGSIGDNGNNYGEYVDVASASVHISWSRFETTGSAGLLIGSASLITGSADSYPNVSASYGSFTNFVGRADYFIGDVYGFTGYVTDFIGQVFYDHREILWATDQTDGYVWGLDYYSGSLGSGVEIRTDLQTNDVNGNVQGIAIDIDSGSLWIGTVGPYIYQYDIRNITFVRNNNVTAKEIPITKIVDIGRPNFCGFHARYDQYTKKVYVAGYSDNTVAIVDPNSKFITIKEGFDLPLDIVFTPTKQFAVQHGEIGLKEIILTGTETSMSFGQPNPPVLLSVDSGSAILTWNSGSNDQTLFGIERSTDGINYSDYDTVTGSVSTYTDNAVSIPNVYWYKVYAENNSGRSFSSNDIRMSFAPPLAPILAQILGVASMSWAPGSNDQESFSIFRSTDNSLYSEISNVGPSIRNYLDVEATESIDYWFKLAAINQYGTSSYSNTELLSLLQYSCSVDSSSVNTAIWNMVSDTSIGGTTPVPTNIVTGSALWSMHIPGNDTQTASITWDCILCNPSASYLLNVTIPWTAEGSVVGTDPYIISAKLYFNDIQVSSHSRSLILPDNYTPNDVNLLISGSLSGNEATKVTIKIIVDATQLYGDAFVYSHQPLTIDPLTPP